jgi:outer membrane protein, multidrug efflux system
LRRWYGSTQIRPLLCLGWGIVVVLFLSGCLRSPGFQRPTVDVPTQWRTPVAQTESLADMTWWEYYQDSVLTNLLATALANNTELRIASARVEEAMGGYRAQRSFLFPSVNGSAAWTRGRVGDLPPAPGTTSGQFDVFGLLSYEVDLWGRLRRLSEAERARVLGSEEARRTVQIALIANVATTYFSLRALDRQLEIARETYASRTEILELTRYRFNAEDGLGQGISSELDVRQAETQVHTARSTIASLQRAIGQTENALRFLVGAYPGAIPRGQTLQAQWQPSDLPAGLPSELLLRRPDISAAEQQLLAAEADIGAARAAYFPTISLTAALGVQSLELEDLFSTGTSRAWRFAPQLVAPIFNAGRIRAGVQVASARQQSAIAAYEQSILNAFREVDDALTAITHLREQLAADEANVEAEQRRFELSRLRYEEGISSYSDLLDAQRFLFNAELSAVQTRNELLAATAQLYKALGGGVTVDAPNPPVHAAWLDMAP